MLDYFSKDMSWIWTGPSKKKSWSAKNIAGKERVVSLHPFLLAEVGIYKRLFIC